MSVELISIDNMYEDDGLANLYACLNGLLLAPDKGARRLVAIVPEYSATGRLDRVNVLARDPQEDLALWESGKYDPGVLDVLAEQISNAGRLIAGDRQRRYAEAVKKLDDAPPVVVVRGARETQEPKA